LDVPLVYQKEQRTESAGIGCLIQFVGVLLAILSVSLFDGAGAIAAIFILIVFLVVGAEKSKRLVCGKCGNPIADKQVMICPTCHVELE